MVSFVFTTKYTTSLITVCLHDTHHRRNFNLWASNFLGTPSFWNRCSSSQWNCTDLLSQISQFEFYSPTCLLAAGVGGREWNLHDSYCKAYLVKSIHINQSFKTSRSCESCILQPWGTLRNGPALVWSVLSDPPELAWNHCGTVPWWKFWWNWGRQKANFQSLHIHGPLLSKKTYVML